jgi:hypothetical protein
MSNLKTNISQKPILKSLTYTIRKIFALSGLTIASHSVCAEALINPNEIWLGGSSELQRICVKDFNQDDDLDIFAVFQNNITLLENIGSSTSPKFTQPVVILSNPSTFKLNRLGLTDCVKYGTEPSALVDIDADGDLDLFTGSQNKGVGVSTTLSYAINNGTNKNPIYIDSNPEELGLPSEIDNIMFRDIDGDGDQDFLGSPSEKSNPNSLTGDYYENIGTAENPQFVNRHGIDPVEPLCNKSESSTLGFLADFNNDGKLDMLCKAPDNSIDYIESNNSSYSQRKNLFTKNFFGSIFSPTEIDIDNDNDIDIIAPIENKTTLKIETRLFTNISTNSIPQFGNSQPYTSLPEGVSNLFFSDLDGDNDLDYIYTLELSKSISYAINIGTNTNPEYEFNRDSSEFERCNSSLSKYRTGITGSDFNPNVIAYEIENIILNDIDGDNDQDLFLHFSVFSSSKPRGLTVFCENKGNTSKPFFTSGIENPFGLDPAKNDHEHKINLDDMDGDGDQDAWIGTTFYDNIGNSKKPLFQNISEIPTPLTFAGLLNMDGDGKTDSYLKGKQLIYKGIEPVSDIAATRSVLNTFFLVTKNESQVQLQYCLTEGFCIETIVLPNVSQEFSISTGDFNTNSGGDVVLAMIDNEGFLKIKVFDRKLQLIGSASGGKADSISIAAGQLDNDPADEYVISFVQPNGVIAAIAYNLDGSRIGKAVVDKGKQPSIDIGKFDGKNNAYVLAYLDSDNQVKSATFRGDGSLIGKSTGERASYVSVKTANILPSSVEDEYIISIVQEDGTPSLIGFTANSTRLGKVTGNDFSLQPKVLPGQFPLENSIGLTVSLIQSDKKPALVFLDNKGNHLATGVGGVSAILSTHVLTDNNADQINEAVLIYVDELGIPRWEVFGADGVKK